MIIWMGIKRRTLNKYVGTLTELINMNGWSELVEVLTGYWDSQEWCFGSNNQNYPDFVGDKRLHRHSRHWDRKESEKTKKTSSSPINLP